VNTHVVKGDMGDMRCLVEMFDIVGRSQFGDADQFVPNNEPAFEKIQPQVVAAPKHACLAISITGEALS
jgi:hypothetical protein